MRQVVPQSPPSVSCTHAHTHTHANTGQEHVTMEGR